LKRKVNFLFFLWTVESRKKYLFQELNFNKNKFYYVYQGRIIKTVVCNKMKIRWKTNKRKWERSICITNEI